MAVEYKMKTHEDNSLKSLPDNITKLLHFFSTKFFEKKLQRRKEKEFLYKLVSATFSVAGSLDRMET